MTAPGFFGKLRSHGDFVARRLAPAMRQPFDAWLQAGIVHSRADLGAAWLPTYLNSPLWRFVLAPGVCGPQAWAGVMMPSVDRVGRCFPLVLAVGLHAAPDLAACLGRHAAWFVQLEDLALSTLDQGFVLDAFDATLQAVDGAPGAATAPPGMPSPAGRRVVFLDDGPMPPLAQGSIDGSSAWWTEGAEKVAPCLAVCPALPAPAGFAALLDGGWERHGWRLA